MHASPASASDEAPRGKPRGIFAEPSEAKDAIPPCDNLLAMLRIALQAGPQSFLAKDDGENFPAGSGEQVLIIGLNWLGDSVMAMPAIQAFAKAFPGKRLTMLVKPGLAELWPMHPAIGETLVCAGSWPEMRKMAGQIRARKFAAAFILPQSFRSALIPFLARIPVRRGMRGHFRSALLTEIVSLPSNPGHLHQQQEYMAILGQEAGQDEFPALRISRVHAEKADAMLGQGQERWIGLIPGAARGPAKIWPADYFAALGQIIRKKQGGNIVIFGSAAEKDLCARVCAGIGGVINHAEGVINLAGRTNLPALAALMARCSVVIGNDSGGVHLAAAAGAAVIAIFGITDPAKTRPLGKKVVVLQDSLLRARDIPRRSAEAEESLKKISPELVAEAVRTLLNA